MIRVDISRCTGCRRCETTCAFFHSGRVSNRLARIKVLNLYESGVDGPVLCCQCRERYCTRCPEQALSIGRRGQVIASPTVCKLCGACEQSCPIGAIEIFNDIVHVCDLCGGEPRCVATCTEGAITWVDNQQEAPSLAELKTATRKLSPVQKRLRHLQQQAAELRRAWQARHG
jgi:Fe-S-cluster-containing hydrogenase component 2